MKLLIKDNKIKIRKAVIDLTELNSNRLCLSAYTSLGKSRLVDIMIAQNYTNVKILRDIVLEDVDFLRLSKAIEIVVLDDCSFNKQHETFLKRFIIQDSRLYIFIGRKIFIPGMECLDFLNYNNKIIVQKRLNLNQFLNRFNLFNFNTKKENIILIEDAKSGLFFYQKLFKDVKVISSEGVSFINNKIIEINKKYNYPNIFLCIDFIPDNPEVLDDLNKIVLSDNIMLINTHTIEELIFIDKLKKYKYYNNIRKEIKLKNNTIDRDCKDVYLCNIEGSRSFESLLTTILAKNINYSKSEYKFYYNDNNYLINQMLDKYEIYVTDNLKSSDKTNHFN